MIYGFQKKKKILLIEFKGVFSPMLTRLFFSSKKKLWLSVVKEFFKFKDFD